MRGFTLLELIIVVALIGTLGTWIITLIDPAQQFKRGRDAERKSEVRQIQTALELYRSDQGAYPVELPDCNSPLTVDSTVIYIQKIPCDPTTTGLYPYESDGLTYSLIACLENLNDSQKDTDNRLNPSGGTYCDGSTTWSYTVTNP